MKHWSETRVAGTAGADLVRGHPDGRAADGPTRVVIDSREVGPGDLFVGIPGEQVDGGAFDVHVPLPGRFNVLNALGAWAAVRALGVSVTALPDAARVPGRFEPVVEGQPFAVLVDYAHTPDSLENALLAARELAEHRVIAVFGAGGDRDRGKRPLMGAIAAREADIAIVTSDNPRSEDPDAIVAEVLAGAEDRSGVEAEVDRRAAIRRAVELAEPGDVVVIAGKGHEQGQEFAGGRKEPFDDVAVAREALRSETAHG